MTAQLLSSPYGMHVDIYRQHDAFAATNDDIVTESLTLKGFANSFDRVALLFPRCLIPVRCTIVIVNERGEALYVFLYEILLCTGFFCFPPSL